jgi:hypothetical protein
MPSKIKRNKTGTPIPFHKPEQKIELRSPQAANYGPFIVGNAQFCDRVAEPDSAKGQHLVLCGAGPSLAENAAEYCPTADQVWGCNSAMTWLHDHGHKVTHGFAIDQNPEMVAEWASAPDVDYLIASSVHPHLTQYLLSKGRRLTFFHNFVGIKQRPVAYAYCHACDGTGPFDVAACPKCGNTELERQHTSYEDWLYCSLYPGTIRAGSGLNAVTRALDVARFMGFEKITVLGADCSLRVTSRPPDAPAGSEEHMRWLREETVMHADGGSALASNATPVTLGGEIDAGTPDETVRPGHGRWWETKPDLMISAIWLVQMARKVPGLTLVGDTLPNALKGKSASFLSKLPNMVDSAGNAIEFTLEEG